MVSVLAPSPGAASEDGENEAVTPAGWPVTENAMAELNVDGGWRETQGEVRHGIDRQGKGHGWRLPAAGASHGKGVVARRRAGARSDGQLRLGGTGKDAGRGERCRDSLRRSADSQLQRCLEAVLRRSATDLGGRRTA